MAHVIIKHRPGSLELEIVDDGHGALDPVNGHASGGGRGLIGMKERVSLFGGEMTTGPSRDGGYRVHVTLPVPGGTA